MEAQAATLASKPAADIVDRLCAVSLLDRHTSEAARVQLTKLGRDIEPTVAAAALGVLLSIDPALVLPLVEESLQNPDANVRLRAAEGYIALPTVDRVAVLAHVLDDQHPAVRGRVREALFVHAKQAELDFTVRNTAMEVLSQESWRGQEQAALLLAALDHKPAAPRLIELLESPRPEVMVATAWGLRKLALPETLPALLDKAERQSAVRVAGTTSDTMALDRQLGHLFEAMGLMNHTPAITLMKTYVPKDVVYEKSRSAAVWSLGLLLKGQSDEALARQLIGRAKDVAGMPPELELVRQMSVLTIGRMRSESQLPGLQELLAGEVDPDPVDMAVAWAIHEITGEEFPPPVPIRNPQGGWFLQPLRPKSP